MFGFDRKPIVPIAILDDSNQPSGDLLKTYMQDLYLHLQTDTTRINLHTLPSNVITLSSVQDRL